MLDMLLSFSLFCAVNTTKCNTINIDKTHSTWAICDTNMKQREDMKLVVGETNTQKVKILTITFNCQEV